jgi:hypothetical protein
MRQLKPQHLRIFAQGRRLREQLPSYLEGQEILLAAHCTISTVLLPLVAAYAKPTHEDIWKDLVQLLASSYNSGG